MLKLLLIIPLLGCLPLIIIKEENKSLLKSIALSTSLLNLFISIIM